MLDVRSRVSRVLSFLSVSSVKSLDSLRPRRTLGCENQFRLAFHSNLRVGGGTAALYMADLDRPRVRPKGVRSWRNSLIYLDRAPTTLNGRLD
ncbi:hypothetical protein VNO77_41982 [Canavalia gladiata]|uniref:Uncharacterized protein n=1 Tax=Canavalia gladiata TaxID=3824 RepID=A0AAN9K0S6_CANGL